MNVATPAQIWRDKLQHYRDYTLSHLENERDVSAYTGGR